MDDLDLTILSGFEVADEGPEYQIPAPLEDSAVTKEMSVEKISVSDIELPAALGSLDDIRSLWLAARSPGEVASQARSLPFGIWMDYAIKLSPKQVKMSGQVDLRAAFVNLGPPQKRS